MSPELKLAIIETLKELNPKEIAIFGSYARGEEHPESDIDILIDYHDAVNFFETVRAIRKLESLIGIKVDLVDRGAASSKFMNSIHPDLIKIYSDVKRSA